MNEQKHIINCQVLELTIPEHSRAQPIQTKTSEIIKYKLQLALDNLFSKLSTTNEIVRIEKLVIDLGTISENELEKVLVERSLKKIGDKISRLKNSGLTNTGIKPVSGDSIDSNGKAAIISKSTDLLDQFVYFLQFGRFPWWHKSDKSSAKPGTSQLNEILEEVLKFEVKVLKSAVVPLLSKPFVRKRLGFQFSDSQLDELLKKLNKKLFETFFSMFQVLRSSVKSTQNRNDLTESFYKIALQYFSAEQEVQNDDLKVDFVKDLLSVFLNKYSIKENEILLEEILKSIKTQQRKKGGEISNVIVIAVVQMAVELRSQNEILQQVIRDILLKSGEAVNKLVEQRLKLKERKTGESQSILKPNPVKNSQDFVSDDGNGANGVNGIGKKTEEKPFSLLPPKPTDDAEGIVISNAGLVLIHPFLRYFFDGLGLLDNELHFKSQSDVFKAIHLLQYIVSETESVVESEFPLNKILCGIDIAEPVPNSFQLSDEEKGECVNLIKTVLERWSALKTTNPAALRDTYLQRAGILKQSGQSWSLTIERNSFDVMLEKLPWSISLIKLPWLSQILYVEW